MKLLRIVRSMSPSSGGISAGIREMHQSLKDHGFIVKVACLDDPNSPWSNDLDGDLICLGPVNNKYGYSKGLSNKICMIARDFDVAIIEGIWSYHSFACWRAFRGIDLPYFVYTHGMLDPWFKNNFPIKHLKKWIFWPWSDYRVLRDSVNVLFTTEQERLLARESFWLYKANEYVTGYGISSPPEDIESQRDKFLTQFPCLRGKRILLFLSRIHPKKGLDLLIDAFASIANSDQNLCLVIAGPDQIGFQSQLELKVKSAGITHQVHWLGMVTGDLKWGAFRSADLFCLPSHQENFGVVVAEALACRVPVAISKPVNLSTDVLQANAGIVHDDTSIGTKDALRRWLHMSSSQIDTMVDNGFNLYSSRFKISAVVNNLIPILHSTFSEDA
jgi:glycosyltransferase involved in cell wall biosynthesis